MMSGLSEFGTSEGRAMLGAVIAFLSEGHVLPELSANQTVVICVAVGAYIISRGLAKSGWVTQQPSEPKA